MKPQHLLDERLILAVAQQPFEVPSPAGAVNVFCTLVPVWHEDGEPASAGDFPNNGLVWWKLRTGSKELADPGRLVSAPLEHALQYKVDDPTKQLYQVVPNEVEPLGENDAVEVLRADARVVRSPRELVNTLGAVETDHIPGVLVLVRLGDVLYGPLRTKVVASSRGLHRVSVSAAAADGTVRRVEADAADHVIDRLSDIVISLDNMPRYRSANLSHCAYEIVRAERVDDLLRAGTLVELPRDEDLILRAARRLLARKERQQLAELLERLGTLLDGEGPTEEQELVQALARQTGHQARSTLELARSVIDSGVVDERVAVAIDERAREEVDERSAALAAEIERRTADVAAALKDHERRRAALETEILERTRLAEAELQSRIEEAWREHRRSIADEHKALDEEKARLEAQRATLAQTVADAAERYATQKEVVIADAMALLPILEATGRTYEGEASTAATPAAPTRQPRAALELPAFVLQERSGQSVDEATFFRRFERHVSQAGFRYRSIDLRAFHNAWKCTELVLVAGPPGSGKSSLSRLHAEALHASALLAADPRSGTRLLRVAARPTWLDASDVLGHVNPIDGSFLPGTSGIVRHLVSASEEFLQHGGRSGLYTVCIDDADLAPIEAWFADLMQTVGSPESGRVLRLFDRQAVSSVDPFLPWAELHVPRSVRWVCTLSGSNVAHAPGPRVYDRAGVVTLHSPGMPEVATRSPAGVEGPAITLEQVESWVRDAPLPASLSAALDSLSPVLARCGATVGPRTYRSLCRLVASAEPVLAADAAFDVQVAGSLLSYARFDRDDVDQLLDTITALDVELPECERALRGRRDALERLEL